MRFLLGLTLIFFLDSISAAKMSSLSFPAEKNYLKVIPQIFEYSLPDEHRLQIGNVIFNTKDFRWQRASEKSSRIQVSWPEDWISKGQVTVQDPAGKNLYSKLFDSNSRVELDVLDEEMIRYLKKIPFFKICLFQLEGQVRFYLCSPELALDNKEQIFQRRPLQEKTEIDINGRPADHDGRIYLNLPTEFISLRLHFVSGTSLEIETRMKPIEYFDVMEGDSPSEIRIRALGPMPIKAAKFKKLDDFRWEAAVQKDRPFLYLKSEAGIPLRQEFHLEGPLRPRTLEIPSEDKQFTYASEENIQVNIPPSVTVSPVDNRSSVSLERNPQTWNLKDLQLFSNNERLLRVNYQGQRFIAAYDIQRMPSDEVSLFGYLPFWGKAAWTHAFNQHHALAGSWDQPFAKTASEPSSTAGALTYLYYPGVSFPYAESNFAATVSLTQQKMDSENFQYFSVGFVARQRAPKLLGFYGDWVQESLDYGILSLSSSDKIQGPYDLAFSLKKFWSAQYSFEYGLRLKSMKVAVSDASLSLNKTFLFAGINFLF